MSTWRRTFAALILALAPAFVLVAMPRGAEGAGTETVHVVGKGQTIDQVAKKYGVSVKSIVSANKLKDPTSLKAGTKLVIPNAKGSASTKKSFESKPKHPGRVTLVRFGSNESQVIQAVTKKGKLMPGVMPRFARMMRFGKLNMEHPIDPKLIARVAQVSDHFGGKPIEIISGFRPKTLTQFTPHSNHNLGRAIDMRIAGVPNEVLRDYCKTFKSAGVGYYPNSLFVHFDVRATSTYWVDLSKPGEPPKYVGSATDVDHSVDDTLDDMTPDAVGSSSVAPSSTASAAASSPPPVPSSVGQP